MDPRVRYFYRTWYRVRFLVPAWDAEEFRLTLATSLARIDHSTDPRSEFSRQLATQLDFKHVVLTSTGRFALEVG